MLGFFVWVIVLCIAAIILFGVIFGLLQARDRRMLCWKEKRPKDAIKCEYNGINLTQEDIENDIENFNIIRNRNFRNGSIPESHDPLCRVQVNNLENVVKFSLDTPSSKSNSQPKLENSTSQPKLEKSSSRNTLKKHSSRNSQLGENTEAATASASSSKRYQKHCDRKSHGVSDKKLRRNYTDSYVSYDINSSLTRTLATENGFPSIPGKGHGHAQSQGHIQGQGHSQGQDHYIFHGSRSSGALRH
jgi:hypothetical protein